MATKASRIALAGSNISSTGEVDADLIDGIDSLDFLSLDSNGNLGIGTTSPDALLHVQHTSVNQAFIVANRYNDSSSGSEFRSIFAVAEADPWAVGETATIIGNHNRHIHIGPFFDVDGTVNTVGGALTILSTGNIGIGEPNPAEKLEVDGSLKVGNLKIQNAYGGRIGFNRNTANGAIYDSNYPAFQINGATSTLDYLSFEAYTSAGAGSNAMAITDTGKVAVGLTSDIGSKFNVNSEISLGTDNNNRMIISAAAGVGSIGTIQAGSANFSTMKFDGGNVGIGTSSPGARLSFGNHIPSNGQTIHTFQDGNTRSGLGIVAGVHRMFTSTGSSLSYGHVSVSDGSTYTERMRLDSSGKIKLLPDGYVDGTQTLGVINISSAGSGETRAIDIDGSWSPGESKSISFIHGTASSNFVGQISVIHNNPSSSIRFGKLYHNGDSSTHTMTLESTSTTGANLSLSNGNFKVANGHGIDFSAYGAGTDISSNLLDDYEEGTWTPTTNGTNPTVVKANYTKIGNTVHLFVYLHTLGNSTGDEIHGLPFAPSGNMYASARYHSNSSNYWRYILRTNANSTSLRFLDSADSGVAITTATNSFLVFSLTYETNA